PLPARVRAAPSAARSERPLRLRRVHRRGVRHRHLRPRRPRDLPEHGRDPAAHGPRLRGGGGGDVARDRRAAGPEPAAAGAVREAVPELGLRHPGRRRPHRRGRLPAAGRRLRHRRRPVAGRGMAPGGDAGRMGPGRRGAGRRDDAGRRRRDIPPQPLRPPLPATGVRAFRRGRPHAVRRPSLPLVRPLPIQSAMSASSLPTRAELDPAYTWDLAATYPDEHAYLADLEATEAALQRLVGYQGRLGESAVVLADFFDLYWQTLATLQKLNIYANMPLAVDQGDQTARARAGRFQALATRANGALAFMRPELLELGQERVAAFMEAEPRLRYLERYFERLEASRPYVRSLEVEQVLGQLGDALGTAMRAYNSLANGELPFRPVTDAE